MSKKILSLILAGVLLLQASCFFTFAGNADEIDIDDDANPPMVDYCKNYPKNKYGQTVDIDCATLSLITILKAHNGNAGNEINHVGPTGEQKINIWSYDKIESLFDDFRGWLTTAKENFIKSTTIGSILDSLKKIFNFDSQEQAAPILKDFLKKNNIYNFSDDDIEKNLYEYLEEIWSLKYDQEEAAKTNIGFWKKHSKWNLLFPLSIPCLAIGDWIDEKNAKKEFLANKRKEYIDEALRNRRKNKACSLGLEKIIHSIYRKDWEGNDALVVIFNFGKDDNDAKVYFTNIGIGNSKKGFQAIEKLCAVIQNNYIEGPSFQLIKKSEIEQTKEDL